MLLRILIYILLLFLPLLLMKFYIIGKHYNPDESSISIYSIGLNTNLCFEGKSCLDRGVWVKYRNIQGNVVLTGHLFTLFPLKSGVFANIDKVKRGDIIVVKLNSEEYLYKVVDRYVVDPMDIEIESQEFTHFLTLYTCYPLLTANMRYVVRAELME